MTHSDWFHSPDADSKPSNVIRLPIKDYRLMNGMTSSEMREYCRDFARIHSGDEGMKRG